MFQAESGSDAKIVDCLCLVLGSVFQLTLCPPPTELVATREVATWFLFNVF
jgi:hypothetical protein